MTVGKKVEKVLFQKLPQYSISLMPLHGIRNKNKIKEIRVSYKNEDYLDFHRPH